MSETPWPALVEKTFRLAADCSPDDSDYASPEVVGHWHWATLDAEVFSFRNGKPLADPQPHGLGFRMDTSVDVYRAPADTPAKMAEALEKLSLTFANQSGTGNTFRPVADLPAVLGKWATEWQPKGLHKDLFLKKPEECLEIYASPEGTLFLSRGDGLLLAYFLCVFGPRDAPLD